MTISLPKEIEDNPIQSQDLLKNKTKTKKLKTDFGMWQIPWFYFLFKKNFF